MTNVEIIAEFLKPPPEGAYIDERLAMLLAHAEDGRLVFDSCCCLIGIPTADHPLQGEVSQFENFLPRHYQIAKYGRPSFDAEAKPLPGMGEAERAFSELGSDDRERRAKLIPIIQKELSRREALRFQVNEYVGAGQT